MIDFISIILIIAGGFCAFLFAYLFYDMDKDRQKLDKHLKNLKKENKEIKGGEK